MSERYHCWLTKNKSLIRVHTSLHPLDLTLVPYIVKLRRPKCLETVKEVLSVGVRPVFGSPTGLQLVRGRYGPATQPGVFLQH